MVDELNTEEDARMDELETRTRALAARVETLTAERDALRVTVRELELETVEEEVHRLVAERDAAVKAKEEAERRIHDYMSADNRVAASLRAQVDCGQDGVCAVAPGCTRHWEERNRELAAQVEQMRGERDRLHALVNTPEVIDFAKAVQIEAAHQKQRWNDSSKTDADWFWLIGYLAGKALHNPGASGDGEKRLHRIVTIAAAAANWHAAVLARAALSPSPASGVAEGNELRCSRCGIVCGIAASPAPFFRCTACEHGADEATR